MLTPDSSYVAALPRHKRDLFASLSSLPAVSAIDQAGSRWPVAIVGAGPSGTAAAIRLRRSGCPVLLLDRAVAPREKVCGDGLVADSYAGLTALGMLELVRSVGHSTRIGRIVSPSGFETTVTADFTTLERHFLDGLLLREAIERGATFRRGRVQSVEPGEDGTTAIRIEGVAKHIRADYLIVASGATTRPWWTPGGQNGERRRGEMLRAIEANTCRNDDRLQQACAERIRLDLSVGRRSLQRRRGPLSNGSVFAEGTEHLVQRLRREGTCRTRILESLDAAE